MTESRHVLLTECDFGPDATAERHILGQAGFELSILGSDAEDEIVTAVERTHAVGLLVQKALITRQLLERCPHVRFVVRYGVGLDNTDLEAARELGVTVSNVPDYGTNEVADHAVTMILMLLRGVRSWSDPVARGDWPRRGTVREPRELGAVTLGLAGLGAIARQVGARARAFGMTVISHDPFVDESVGDADVEMVSWSDLWARSDVVSLHMPLGPSTQGVVGDDALASLRPGGLLVNTARAGLVDRDAFERALADGRIEQAAFDVWWEEPPRPDDPLLKDPRVLVTPHVAWLSAGAIERLRRGAAEMMVRLSDPHR